MNLHQKIHKLPDVHTGEIEDQMTQQLKDAGLVVGQTRGSMFSRVWRPLSLSYGLGWHIHRKVSNDYEF